MDFLRVLLEFCKRHPAVSIIFLSNLIFFLLIHVPTLPNQLIFEKMVGNIAIANGEWWRLVTPIWIHTSLPHFVFNSFALILLGTILEPLIKNGRFIILYIGAGMIGNLFTYFMASLTFVHAGSSGAIFGLLGTIAVLIYFKKVPAHQAQPLTIFIILAIIFSFLQPGVNEWAHLGGFSSGLAYGFWYTKRLIRW